jgi:hypothetical protein
MRTYVRIAGFSKTSKSKVLSFVYLRFPLIRLAYMAGYKRAVADFRKAGVVVPSLMDSRNAG